MTQPDGHRIEVEAGPDALAEIENLLEAAWTVHPDVPHPVRTQVGIAAGEIGANIIEHAAPARVEIVVQVLTNAVRVEFADDGCPLQVDLSAAALPDEMAERGRGLALAKAVLEQLSYQRNAMNHWILVSKPFA